MKGLHISLNLFHSLDDLLFKDSLSLFPLMVRLGEQLGIIFMIILILTEVILLGEWLLVVNLEVLVSGVGCYSHLVKGP